ncbi:hypothetical protein [uncultured Algoriphagus sp.]|uniref:hypothetical protein n=1 Tax=uncultured Algoriphagus sp. TaxID=417365 RepID=UPI00258C6182|nr:hypothetical protein [uncultured Algoriphagus sp.]
MTVLELKSRLIKLVEETQNEDLLEMLVDFLSKQHQSTQGALWDDLSEEQKQEVLDSYQESEKEENLLEKDKLFRFLK